MQVIIFIVCALALIALFGVVASCIILFFMGIRERRKLLTGDRVMSKLSRIERLEEQISCGAGGHRITLAGDSVWHPDETWFKCTLCDLKYRKMPNNLTKKEKALLNAFDMKE